MECEQLLAASSTWKELYFVIQTLKDVDLLFKETSITIICKCP